MLVEVPEGYEVVPNYRGYACLGAGFYVINVSDNTDGNPAELIISIASEEEKAGRAVGERRENPVGHVIYPEQMAVRLRFLSVEALDALEGVLRDLRCEFFTPKG